MFHPSLLALALLLPAASFASAAELHVPADYPTLQAAIDAASPNDVIIVKGPSTQDAVVIDKPLTILGDPLFTIDVGCVGFGSFSHGFGLKGPGSGRVVIGNVDMITSDCSVPASAIFGGGFDELHVFGATLKEPYLMLSGVGPGYSTIKVDVPHILIEGSEIVGGKSDADDCYGYLIAGSWSAIEAPSSTVTILDSKISGGGPALNYCCSFCGEGICPTDLPMGGEGGNGVVASEVFIDAASVVAGGIGSTFVIHLGDVHCAKKPDGVAFIAGAIHTLPGNLDGSGATPLGGAFTLSFDVPGPLAVLFFSTSVGAPALIHGVGYSFLVSPVLVGPVATGAPQSLSFPVPQEALLLGLEGAFQIFDLTLGLTAPAVGVLGP